MKAGPSEWREGCSEQQPEGPGGNLGTLMLQGVEQEQQLERKKSIQVGAKRGAEASLEKGKKEKGSN